MTVTEDQLKEWGTERFKGSIVADARIQMLIAEVHRLRRAIEDHLHWHGSMGHESLSAALKKGPAS